jgi:hypothetical protein
VSTDGSRPFYFLAIEFCSRDTDKLWPRSQLADIPANEFPVGTAHIYGLRNSQTGCMEGSNLFDCRYNIATWRRDGIWRAKTWRAFNRVRSFERAQLNLAIRERRALCRQTIFCRDSSSSGEDIARVGFRRSSKTLTGKKQKKRERERDREFFQRRNREIAISDRRNTRKDPARRLRSRRLSTNPKSFHYVSSRE